MPIYEFKCEDCKENFEKLVRSAMAVDEVTCPNCGSPKIVKQISSFAAKVSGSLSSFGSTSASNCATGST